MAEKRVRCACDALIIPIKGSGAGGIARAGPHQSDAVVRDGRCALNAAGRKCARASGPCGRSRGGKEPDQR